MSRDPNAFAILFLLAAMCVGAAMLLPLPEETPQTFTETVR